MSQLTPDQLTGREREVAGLVLQVMKYKEMAGVLRISARTAQVHVNNIARKIGPSSTPAYRHVLRWAMLHHAALAA